MTMMDQRRRLMKERSGPDHQRRRNQKCTVVPLRFSEVMKDAQVRLA
jgi:hypothetical protein